MLTNTTSGGVPFKGGELFSGSARRLDLFFLLRVQGLCPLISHNHHLPAFFTALANQGFSGRLQSYIVAFFSELQVRVRILNSSLNAVLNPIVLYVLVYGMLNVVRVRPLLLGLVFLPVAYSDLSCRGSGAEGRRSVRG